MSLTLFIARRYMFSRSRLGAVGWITRVSAVAIGVVAMAMVLVLSVYNGYVRMIEGATGVTTPELVIAPREGTTLSLQADARLGAAITDSCVAHYAPVLEGLGVLSGGLGDQLVEVVGVDEGYWSVVPSDSLMLEGGLAQMPPDDLHEIEPIVLGLGVAPALEHAGHTEGYTLFFPRRQGVINPLLPSTAFRSHRVQPSGLLRPVSEELDRKAFVRLPLLSHLLGYEAGIASYIAIKPRGAAEDAQARLRNLLPEGYEVLDREGQHPELTLLIRVEKFMVYVIMLFILLLATFNLISGLSMLVMEKRADLSMLSALGMRQGQQRRAFALVGLLVSLLGASLGLLLGFALGYVQQTWAPLVAGSGPLAMPFPIEMKAADFGLILLGMLAMSAATSAFLSLFMRRLGR